MLVPSAAAVMGTVTMQCSSSPRRSNRSWAVTTISTKRSPAGPPLGPTSPSPESWMRVPVSTPGGICTVRVRRVRTRPSPEHSWQGWVMVVPNPWH